MKKWVLLIVLHISLAASAQFTVRLIVTDVATRKNDDIYVSGNFNSWNPHDENYKLKPFGGSRKSVVIKDLAAGVYAFKFVRGAVDKYETTADGRDISDRVLEVNGDLSLEFTIPGWKDEYPELPRRYTASPQVRIIDSVFNMPQLNRKRRIWVYLPKGYATSSKTYPVLYMQEGQNLFNEKTDDKGEWGVDECLDTLQKKLDKECIVVGIDHGGDKRNTEYNPYDNVEFGKGEGKLYSDFLAHTLKPFMDSKYRTKKSPENTYVAGSGLGGLISFYTLLQYPDVFGGAGVLSPSLYLAPFIYSDAESFNPTTVFPRFYFYGGKKENTTMISDMDRLTDILRKKQSINLRSVIAPLGQTNENYWRQEFPGFYTWMVSQQ